MRRIVLAFPLVLAVFAARLSPAAQPPGSMSDSPGFISEIIPIKYEVVADIAAMLNGLPMPCSPSSTEPTTVLFQRLFDAAHQVERLGPRNIGIDERSNLLLVSASPSDLASIKNVVATLDVGWPQILIEAVILEIPLRGTMNSPRSAAQSLTKLGFGPRVSFYPSDPTKPSDSRCGFSFVVPVAGDLFAAAHAFASNAGAALLSRPRIQMSDSVPATFWWGVSPRPFLGPLADMAIQLTCSITTNGCMLVDIRHCACTYKRTESAEGVMHVPVYYSRTKIEVRDSETVMLGGAVETVRTPVFQRVDLLDHVPWAGSLLNNVITYPTRKRRVEVVVLLRATVISPPPVPP